VAPDSLRVNQWALTGDWRIERRARVLNRADGWIAFRFHARDVAEPGHRTLVQPQFCQLNRQRGSLTDRTFEITFLTLGVEA
jgi:hypothetical protein